MYVLENARGRFYVGQTENLERRVAEHNDPAGPFAQYTHKHGPWRLVWSEEHPTRAAAVVREREIKAMKSARWIRQTLLRQDPPPPAPGC